MDKETEQCMMAQFFDVLEEIRRLLEFYDVAEAMKYIDIQIANIKSQIKEPSANDGKSNDR